MTKNKSLFTKSLLATKILFSVIIIRAKIIVDAKLTAPNTDDIVRLSSYEYYVLLLSFY